MTALQKHAPHVLFAMALALTLAWILPPMSSTAYADGAPMMMQVDPAPAAEAEMPVEADAPDCGCTEPLPSMDAPLETETQAEPQAQDGEQLAYVCRYYWICTPYGCYYEYFCRY